MNVVHHHLRSFLTGERPFRLGLWLLLSLVWLIYAQTDSQGVLAWGALPFHLPWHVGPLLLLPLLPAVGLIWRWYHGQWTWGSWRVTGPLLALTGVSFIHILFYQQWAAGVSLGLCWLIYLGMLNLNETMRAQPFPPGLFWVLLTVIFIQGSVSIGQFVTQHDLGLTWLGEPSLNPQIPGISVVYHNDARWLRAYGLNSHPNRLGLKLAIFLLMLWSYRHTVRGRWRVCFWVALLIGLGGLLTALSRSAWLALGSGGLIYVVAWVRERGWQKRPFLSLEYSIGTLLLVVGLALFALNYGDTITGRVARLDTPLESRSLVERTRDSDLALQIIQTQPWLGIGLGGFVSMAKELNPFAGIVHNVPLLIAAEMGLLGLACWLMLLLLPLSHTHLIQQYIPQTAVWLAFIVVAMFQPEPTPFNAQGAALWGVAAALWTWPQT